MVQHGQWAEDSPGYRDELSGCSFLICTPRSHPELWQQFMDGALASYRRFDVQEALAYETAIDGCSTTVFVVAVDESGRMLGGTRIQGPYQHVDEAHAVTEWVGRPGEAAIRKLIADRIPDGLVEFKSAWVDHESAHRIAVREGLARSAIHVPHLLGARFALSTAADSVAEGWRVSGARVVWWIPPVPYPNERYRTVPLLWDMRTFRKHAAESQLPLLEAEQAALATQAGVIPRAGGLA
ncbi:hypothetical protein D7D52_02680 [Nocardia yunnanensis]|uniref:GNAT family N-acetyltransferase n=2 Tax=Nocardia yunnanensis TaxID=2382165 RepID=A0A386Z592_9NOCA|nr:hypothetical protein D7D52_02680 [Nocardia yunnanensis]